MTMRRLSRTVGTLALCLGSATVQGWMSTGAQAASNAELTRQSLDLQAAVRAIEARLARLEAGTQQNTQMFSLVQEVEQLRAEIARLRGESEVHGNQIDQLGKRQTALYSDVDARLNDLKSAPSPAPTVAPIDEATPAAPESADDEAASYEAALALFRTANYPDAITRFREFVRQWPDSQLASNAQYWIGHAFYALKDYKTALAQHQKLLITYPLSAKVPDALLNMATNQLQLNDTAGAKRTLDKLVADYPGSNAAALAQKRLATLK